MPGGLAGRIVRWLLPHSFASLQRRKHRWPQRRSSKRVRRFGWHASELRTARLNSWPLKFCKHSFTLFTSVAQSWFNSRGDRLTCSLTYFGPPDRYFYSPRFISSCPVYFPIDWFSLPLFGYFFAHRTPVVATPNLNIPGTPGTLGRGERVFFRGSISLSTIANFLILEPRHNC